MGNLKLDRNEVISASEIGQYYFCPKSWYLQRLGYKPNSKMLEFGKDKHLELGRIMYYTERDKKRTRIFSVISLSLFFIALLILLFEVIL